MKRPSPEAEGGHASPDNLVRIEVTLHGETFVQETKTDVFLNNVSVARRGDHVHLRLECVRILMRRRTATEMLKDALHMLDTESKWEIIEPILEELERHGPRRGVNHGP